MSKLGRGCSIGEGHHHYLLLLQLEKEWKVFSATTGTSIWRGRCSLAEDKDESDLCPEKGKRIQSQKYSEDSPEIL